MKIAVIGPLCKDVNIVHNIPRHQMGGVVYYAGNALSALGVRVDMIASSGVENKKFFRDLRCSRLIHILAKGTMEYVNEYSENNLDKRIQRAVVPQNIIGPNDVLDLAQYDLVVLGGLYHDNISYELLRSLSQSSVKIAAAVQGFIRYLDRDRIVLKKPENILRILGQLDYIFLDRSELEFITGTKDVAGGAEILLKNGARLIAVTDASKGSGIFTADQSFSIPAFKPKKVVDPTGAGDSYMAGFLAATGQYQDYEKIGMFAAMTATICIEKQGPFAADQKTVLKRLGW